MTIDLKPHSDGYKADYAMAIVTDPHPSTGGRIRR